MARDLLKGDGLTRATPTSGISQSFDAVARLRVHRAISWIGRAEGEATDLDARYLFYWIAFNAAYADERDVRGEREAFAWFFGQLRDQDDQNRIYDMVWTRFPGRSVCSSRTASSSAPSGPSRTELTAMRTGRRVSRRRSRSSTAPWQSGTPR